MLRILGSRSRLCDGITRRDALHAGALTLAGLSLPDLLAAESSRPARAAGFGVAKSCIILHLYGSPPQHETFDPKPDSDSTVRGDLKPIATSVPGLHIGELLPRTAARMDRVTLIRSMTHPYPIHGVAYALTGVPKIDIPMELNPRDSRHWPYIGSVLDHIERGRRGLPKHVGLPWKLSSRAEPFRRAGPYGGFLGAGFDPVWAEFHGKATATDPQNGIDADMRFQVTPPGEVPITLDRLDKRKSLLEQLESKRRKVDAVGAAYARQQQMALGLLTSSKLVQALDVRREPARLRERYGMTLFGQSVLTARRLVEAGVRLMTVFWDEFKEANSAWDTHVNQYSRLKDGLCPGFDAAFSSLLDDLKARGLFDSTLIVVTTEHGRTPKLNKAAGGGREHWSGAYGTILAGAGIKQGLAYGSTDREAGFPKDNPVSPKDVLATMYHLLGVPPETHLRDREGRPIPLVADGKVLTPALA
jgi:hypothetical protein